jgi:hypothetical protein
MNSEVKVVPDTYEFDDQLRALDRRVDTAEGDGLRARWEFGKVMLDLRIGKLLPRGVLDEKATLIGKSRSEIKFRMLFAERFHTETQLAHAVNQFKSWHEIRNVALARPKDSADDGDDDEAEGGDDPDFIADMRTWIQYAQRINNWLDTSTKPKKSWKEANDEERTYIRRELQGMVKLIERILGGVAK